MKPRPLIDELLDEYFPKEKFGKKERKLAKAMALEFLKSAQQEYAMNDLINTELFYGRGLTTEERDRILKSWVY
ncbi:MAG: hypothetical protein WC998_03675 [Candidatus Paceibacterota bacterium]|jgi:hypothetical protein